MTIKEKIIKYLIKGGFNEDTVIKMVDENIEFAISAFPYAKTAQLAEIISTVN